MLCKLLVKTSQLIRVVIRVSELNGLVLENWIVFILYR